MNDGRFRHKWWGWGAADVTYDMASRTDFWPWIQRVAGISSRATIFDPVDRAGLQLPPRHTNCGAERVLRSRLATHQIRTDDDDRLAHAYGRSYRDLVRIRSGSVDSAPDLVVYPETHEDVVTVVDACQKQGAALMPFGGGTNVVGAVELRVEVDEADEQ